jgi:hypothetical protein
MTTQDQERGLHRCTHDTDLTNGVQTMETVYTTDFTHSSIGAATRRGSDSRETFSLFQLSPGGKP